MMLTTEERRWKAIFDDPATPPELRAEAALRLKIEVPVPSREFDYSAELDSVVESYTGVRWTNDPEAESMNLIAVRVCHALNGFCILGGHLDPAKNEADTEIVLAVVARCKSEWMRDRCRAALRTVLDLPLHGVAIAPGLKQRIEAALA